MAELQQLRELAAEMGLQGQDIIAFVREQQENSREREDYNKEDIGIEQQLYEIVRGQNFALNCLSWKYTEMMMITNEVIPENLVVVR